MATLDPGELRKRNNFNIFLTRIRTGKDFTLVETNGKKVKLDKSILKQLTSITHFDKFRDKKKSIFLPTTSGEYININQIYKDSEFGGIGKARGSEAEISQVNRINSQLTLIFDNLGVDYIPLKIGSLVYQVGFCEITPGRPKCDFHFRSPSGEYVGHVSYKMSVGSSSFRQWSGTSEREEPNIFANKETQDFIQTIKNMFPAGVPNGMNIGRKISEKNIVKNLAVYGNDYSKKRGEKNVDVVMQGILDIKKTKPQYYELTCSSHQLNNGDKIDGNYEPIFLASPSTDRNDHGIPHTRIFIYPIGGKSNIKFV